MALVGLVNQYGTSKVFTRVVVYGYESRTAGSFSCHFFAFDEEDLIVCWYSCGM